MEYSDTQILQIASMVLVVLAIFIALRGIGQIFQRYNAILVIVYFVFLFPIACLHALALGIVGKSKKSRMKAAVKKEADFQMQVEKEIAKRSTR